MGPSPSPISGSQFMAQGPIAAGQMGAANMNVPTLQQPGSIMPDKSSMSQSNWNLANNAVGQMRVSGRSDSFIQSHLGTEMAMLSPNYGLNATQGSQARQMIESGRSGDFIHQQLSGATNQIPKPMSTQMPSATSMPSMPAHSSAPMNTAQFKAAEPIHLSAPSSPIQASATASMSGSATNLQGQIAGKGR